MSIKIKLLALLFLCFNLSASEARKTLTFMVNTEGSPPYLYQNEQGEFVGIIVDILSQLPQYKIEYREYNRLRGELAFYQEKFSLMLTNRDWVAQPDKLLLSLPVMQHKSYLYSLQPFGHAFSIDKITSGTEICTRRLYQYPGLKKAIDVQIIVRTDSPSQQTQMKMLMANRCQYAVMNEHIANGLIINQNPNQLSVYRSPKPTSELSLNIAIQKTLPQVKQDIDTLLAALHDNNRIQAIIDSHTPTYAAISE